MPTRTAQNFTVYAGETRPVEWEVFDEDGAALDISGETVVLRVGKSLRTTPDRCLLDLNQDSEQISIIEGGTPGTDNVVRYDPGLNDLKPAGEYEYSLRVTQAGGDSRIVAVGKIAIRDSITR